MSRGIAPRSNADAYAAAGLPCAVYTERKKSSPTVERLAYDAQIGTAVHKTLAEVVERCQQVGHVEVAEWVCEVARANAVAIPGRGDKARLRVTGLVSGYLRDWLPPAVATFVGAEVSVPNGRVDLAWEHYDHGVFFDEVKTWKHGAVALDSTSLAQIEKYLDAGITRFGDYFAGVRLLTLGNRADAVWFSPDGLIEPLRGTALDFATTSTTNEQEVAS